MPKDLPACSANQLSDCANSRGPARIIALTARHNDFKADVGMTPKLFAAFSVFNEPELLSSTWDLPSGSILPWNADILTNHT